MSHAAVRDMSLLEKCIVHTFKLLASFQKWEDVQNLLNPLTEMLTGFRRSNNENKTNAHVDTKKKTSASSGAKSANIPLEYAIASVMIC